MWPRSRGAPLAAIDLSMPEIVPRSRLFALRPEGLGTDRMEGLTSYLTRIARAHGVSPRRLIREEFARVAPDQRVGSAGRRACSVSTLDGLDRYAEAFVALTAQLTTVPEVRYLTLLPLAGVLPRCSAGLMVPQPRWCPSCLAEMADAGMEISRPLLWSLDLYRVCHRHRRPLILACAHCEASQPFVPHYPELAHCAHCQHSLLEEHSQAHSRAVKEADIQIADALADLAAKLPALDSHARHGNFVNCLNSAVETLGGGNRAKLSRMLSLPRSTVDNWLIRDARPSLGQIVCVACRLGLRPADMLLPGAETCRCTPAAPTDNTRRSLGSRLNEAERKRIKQLLSSIVQNPADRRPLVDVAESMGLKRWRLKYWFPKECATICRKHADAHREEAKESRSIDYGRVARVVSKMRDRGDYPGRRRVNEALRGMGISLSRPDMVAAYRTALQEPLP